MSLQTGMSVHRNPESDTASSITNGAEANGTAPQSHSQSSIKPFGSAAARFQIRSAKTRTTKDRGAKSFFWESGNVGISSQKSHQSKDINKVCSSATNTHTNNDDKETGKTLNKDSTRPISSEKRGTSAEQLNTQENMSQMASDRIREDELGRFNQSNKSKSLDWRVMGSRAGHGNTTAMTSTRDYVNFMRRSNSSEKTETNIDITSTTQGIQPSSDTWIRTYNADNEEDQSSDRKASPVSGCTSLRINRVNFALERTSSGQSLPSRLKPRHSLGSVAQQQGESNLGQADNKIPGSWNREQGPCNAEEVTGNQTIKERINKLFGAHGKSDEHSTDSNRLKRSNTVDTNISFPKYMDTVDSTPSHRKDTTDFVFGTSSDSTGTQQEKPSFNTEKSGTFPRRFSKTNFGPKQEPCINNENRKDQRDNSSGLGPSLSSKTKWSTEMSSVKIPQSLLPDNNKGTSNRLFSGSPMYHSQSLERARSMQAATANYSTQRNESAYSESNSSNPSEDFNPLLTLSRGIKEEFGKDKQSDKETTKRLDVKENRCLGSSQDEIIQPKNLFSSKGVAHSEIQKEGTDDVFTLKPEGRRGEGVLEKFRAPSLDSVKNTISLFESLAQQSKGTLKGLQTKRTLSVPERSKPPPLVKKSDSEKNLHYGRVDSISKYESNKEIEGTLGKVSNSNYPVKVRPTFGRQETHRTVELVPEFKPMNDSRTDVISKNNDVDNRTVVKKPIREPDSLITVPPGHRYIEAKEENAGIPSIFQQSNTKSLLNQQTINVKAHDDDDEEEITPTNSPNSATKTIVIKKPNSTGSITVNGAHSKVLPNLSQSSTPLLTNYSSLNHSNNNNYETSQDLTMLNTTGKARWSSDEENYDEETDSEEDSDSGESSVTITSKTSQSDRRSFSLSLVDLCNFGGVDYKSSDASWLEDDQDLPSSRSASLSSDISMFSSVTLLSTDELDRLLDDVRNLGDDTLKKYEDVQVVVLHKEIGSGLGFTLAGGVDQNKPVTVHKIIPGGVAAREGSIFEGARVLSINGTALQNSAHWEALRTLRKAKGQGMAVVVLQSGNSRKEVIERPGITGRRVRVTLNKSSSDLGFSLEGGLGSSSGDKPLTVQKIFRGGPVSEVFPGDELLEVQGQSLEGMMRLEVWNLIKKLPPGPVEVLLHRPQQSR